MSNKDLLNFPDSFYLNVFIESHQKDVYENANVSLSSSAPKKKKNWLLYTSPIFSIDKNNKIYLEKNYKISFCFTDNPLNLIQYLKSKKDPNFDAFFSVGLASVIIISKVDGNLKSLLGDFFFFVKELWNVENNKIVRSEFINSTLSKEDNITFSETPNNIPEDIKFLVREFQNISHELLEKSELYSPYTFNKIHRLIKYFANEVLEDLYYILDDTNEYPNSPLYKKISDLEIDDEVKIFEKNEMKSDTISLLVQINSSLVYINNQLFSGITPILKNPAQIAEFKLLGIGSGVRALFIMLDHLEVFLTSTKLETLDDEKLLSIKFNGKNTLSFSQLTNHNPKDWRRDRNFDNYQIEIGQTKTKESTFSRMGYFSARLGFKEYRFFATSALQVLISASSNEWSLVNYTHEIIHGHVKYLVQNIIQGSDLALVHDSWMKTVRDLFDLENTDYNVKELGQIAIANYINNSNLLGSLGKSSGKTHIEDEVCQSLNFEQLESHLNSQYWEINEIFVHSLDFFYIYKSNFNLYIRSIWLSWITQPVVIKDVSQYLLRSLLVISLTIDGKPYERKTKAFYELNRILTELLDRSSIFDKILLKIKELENDDAFFRRYINCLVLADFSFQFLTSSNTEILARGDKNILSDLGNFCDIDSPFIYDTEIGDWPFGDVNSKLHYILENTHKAILNYDKVNNMQFLSSRLLLIISST